MSRIWLAALAAVAICSTAGATACLAMLSASLSPLPSVRATAITAAALQGTLLIVLSWFISAHAFKKIREVSKPYAALAFGLGVLASLISVATGALALDWMQTSTSGDTQVRSKRSTKTVSVSVVLAVAVASQIAFMAIHFAVTHQRKPNPRQLFSTREASPWSPSAYIKSIRYSQTMPRKSESEESDSIGLKDTPPSLRNKIVQANPLKLTFPPAIRHTPSRTRLLHAKDSLQSLTLETTSLNPNATQESFDTWDTSSVDMRNRQAVMEASTSPISRTYTLETIPGSPRGSISPGNILDLAPPPCRIPKRSRSHSPATMRGIPRGRMPVSPSELHIHPLFRSDSPHTPPILTPGTMVVAAPEAGQVLSQHPSLQQLPRARSGSLPSMSRRPMAHPTAGDAAEMGAGQPGFPEQERKMTPPVPDWVLNSKVPPIPRKSASRRSSHFGDDATVA